MLIELRQVGGSACITARASDIRETLTYLWRIAQAKLDSLDVVLNTFTSGLSRGVRGLIIYA
jgi:hypothetical protein